MTRVLISDKLSPKAAQIFRDRGIGVDQKVGLSPSELIAIIGDYDGLAVRSATRATADVLAGAGRLKVIGRAGIGVDNIDIEAATGRGIVVMNTPFGNSITTAEHAIAMLLALARQIPAADRSTQQGLWEKSRFMGTEVTGKTLGVVGCGNIGSIVANRGLGLKMTVIAADPYLSPERARALGVEKVELDDLFARADFVTVHTPLIDATRDLIDGRAIEKMKQGVRIINCARGGLVNETALKAAMDSGKVAGAAFDVFVEEPAHDNALFGTENFIATPHLGAATSEAQENVAIQIAEQMSAYLLQGAVTNALNMPSVSSLEAPRLQPYMKLAQLLGGFLGQLTETHIKTVEVEFEGHVTRLNCQPITAVILQSLLEPVLDDSVNMVNAALVARGRNINVTETSRKGRGDYLTRICVTVRTSKSARTIGGTLSANQQPRIVDINGVAMDARVGPHMLFISNDDQPGLIGDLGNLLAEARINIATFNLGRAKKGGRAIALIGIDEPTDPAVLDRIAALAHVRRVKLLAF